MTDIEKIKKFLDQKELPYGQRWVLISFNETRWGQLRNAGQSAVKIKTSFWLYEEPYLLLKAMLESGILDDNNINDFRDENKRKFSINALTALGFGYKPVFPESIVLNSDDNLLWNYVDEIINDREPETRTEEANIKDLLGM